MTATRVEKKIDIKAPASVVWDALTNIESMKQWMAEPEIDIAILTDWKVGSPIVISGFHNGVRFVNTGHVLRFEPDRLLQYTHRSSLSRLPDTPFSHSVIEFRVVPSGDQTTLTLSIENFPAESIRKHLEFYWSSTMGVIQQFIEKKPS